MTTDVELREVVAALKHDLGKYVAWRSTNVEFDEGAARLAPEQVEALQADVLRTRTTRDGHALAAWEVWDAARASLPDSLPDELDSVRAAVEQLRGVAEPLARGDEAELAALVPAIRAAQVEIRVQLRDLQRRLARGD